MAEESLEPSSATSPKPSPTSERASTDGSLPAGTSPDQSPNTPSRKNKRKSSEPRRRSDFAVKKFRPDPDSIVPDTNSGHRIAQEFPPDTPETVISSGSPPDPEDRAATSQGTASLSQEIGWYSIPIQGPNKTGMRASRKSTKKQQQTDNQKSHPVHRHPSPVQSIPDPIVRPVPVAPVLIATPAPLVPGEGPGSTPSTPGFIHPEDDDDEADSPTFVDPITGRPTKRSRKNYKNMTRERRVEANARERSRVHTISAAFESLRRAVPSYSYNQKLSKLAILRIACSYIMALSKLANVDICEKANNFSFIDCVDLCTQTIQTEGRARRRH